MIFGQKNLFDFPGNGLGKKATHIILAPTVKKDISLEALLEEPIEKKPPRNPLEWIGASAMHLLILAALIIIPLYTTGTIHLGEYRDIPLVAPPPPPPPAAVAANKLPRTRLISRAWLCIATATAADSSKASESRAIAAARTSLIRSRT